MLKNDNKMRNFEKWIFVVVTLVFASVFFCISLVSAADPGHGAGSIGSGTFESGNYAFLEYGKDLNICKILI